ncbi:MAG: HAD family hydrolase [Gemmataceae bacterium]
MPTGNIKTIIFDFGNVVAFFDFQIAFRKIKEHTELSVEQITAMMSSSGLATKYETGQMTSEEFLGAVHELLALRCEPEVTKSAWMDIFRPNEAVCSLIPRLKSGYRIQLGSNTNDLHAKQFLKQFADTFVHVDAFTLSHEVGAMKPDARFYEHAVELSGSKPEECVFIDDLKANIEGAMACGLQGVHYTDHTILERRFEELGIFV